MFDTQSAEMQGRKKLPTQIIAISSRAAFRLLERGIVDFHFGPGVSDLEAYKLAVVRRAVSITRGRPC